MYSLLGVFIVVIAGLESAFKWENRSVELRILANTCRKNIYQLKAEIRKIETQISGSQAMTIDEEELKAIKNRLNTVETDLTIVQEKAATLGINILHKLKIIEEKKRPKLVSQA